MTTPQIPTPNAEAEALDSERQPLLGASGNLYTAPNGTDLSVGDNKRNWKTTAFQGCLILLGLAVLGVFIKGFIDAGDVEVCILIFPVISNS